MGTKQRRKAMKGNNSKARPEQKKLLDDLDGGAGIVDPEELSN